MSTPNKAADYLIQNIDWLITVDGKRRVVRDAGLAIRNGKFAAVGKSADISAAWTADRVVHAGGEV